MGARGPLKRLDKMSLNNLWKTFGPHLATCNGNIKSQDWVLNNVPGVREARDEYLKRTSRMMTAGDLLLKNIIFDRQETLIRCQIG